MADVGAAQEIIGAGSPAGAPSGAASQDDTYSQMLGQSGGNILSRFATRYLNAGSGRDLELMRQQHQDRQRQQDLLFQIGSTAASQGLPLGDELAGAYKKLGGSQDVWGALTGLAKQKQQAAQQADQQSMAMLGLKPEDVGMGGPAAGAASAGGGALPPSSGPAGQGAPAGGPQDMGDAGPNAGKHWGDQAFDWQHYMANEPPQIKDIDRQMRVTMFRLDSASRRGQPTQGLKAQLDDLKGQHEELLKSYLGYGQTQEKQNFQEAEQGRQFAHADTMQGRSFKHSEDMQQTRDEKTKQTQIEKLNKSYEGLLDKKRRLQGKKYDDSPEGRALQAQETEGYNDLVDQFNVDNADSGTKRMPLQHLTVKSRTEGGMNIPVLGKVGAKNVSTVVPEGSDASTPPEWVRNPKTGEYQHWENGKYVSQSGGGSPQGASTPRGGL